MGDRAGVAGGLGFLLGAFNAALIYHFRIVSIVVTIATFNLFFGALMFLTGGVSLYDLPDWLSDRIVLVSIPTGDGAAELTLPVAVMALCVLATWLLLRRTTPGRQLYAMGDNPEAARRVGIPTPLWILAAALLWHVVMTRSRLGFATRMIGSDIEATRYSGIDTRRAVTLIYTLSGVIYGSIGERTGNPPMQAEYDAVVRVMEKTAAHARKLGLELGLEAVNRYENHMMNTAEQVIGVIERIGAPNIFLHLDTYHMNIEEKGQANGILKAGKHLKYIHLSESDRGVPGTGTIAWDEVFAGLAGVGFSGGMAMESSIHMPPQLASALSVWRPVANSREEILVEGLPFLRNKAKQYHLI